MMPKLSRNGMVIGASVAALLLVVFLFFRMLTPAQLRGQAGNGGSQCTEYGTFTKYATPGAIDGIAPGPTGNLTFTQHNPQGQAILGLGRMTTAGVLSSTSLPAVSSGQKSAGFTDGSIWGPYLPSPGVYNMYQKIAPDGTVTTFTAPQDIERFEADAYGHVFVLGFTINPTNGSMVNTWYSLSPATGALSALYNTPADYYAGSVTGDSHGNSWMVLSNGVTISLPSNNNSAGTPIPTFGTSWTSYVVMVGASGGSNMWALPQGDSDFGNIAVDAQGNAWIAGSTNVYKVTPAGVITQYTIPWLHGGGDQSVVSDMVPGTDGNMWALGLESNNRFSGPELIRIAPNGGMTMFDIGGSGPSSLFGTTITYGLLDNVGNLIVGPDGNLWLSYSYQQVVGGQRVFSNGLLKFSLCGTGGGTGGQGSSSGTTQCNNGAGTCNAIQSGGSCTTRQVTCPSGTVEAPGASAMACTNDGCTGSCVFCQPSQGNSSSSGIGTNSSGGNNRVVTGPSVCVPHCGDGKLRLNEQCDDGNTRSNDGCSSTCVIEKGWECLRPAGTPCSVICGDGIRAGIEVCDDGNRVNGDGCSQFCAIEPGARCTQSGVGASSAGGGNGGTLSAACTPAECGAQPAGEQSVLCADGSVGGPVCQRTAGGACAWVMRSCAMAAASSSNSSSAGLASCPICPGRTPGSWKWSVPAGMFSNVVLNGTNYSLLNGADWTFTPLGYSATSCMWQATSPIGVLYVALNTGTNGSKKLNLTAPAYASWYEELANQIVDCSASHTLDYHGANYWPTMPQQQQIIPIP